MNKFLYILLLFAGQPVYAASCPPLFAGLVTQELRGKMVEYTSKSGNTYSGILDSVYEDLIQLHDPLTGESIQLHADRLIKGREAQTVEFRSISGNTYRGKVLLVDAKKIVLQDPTKKGTPDELVYLNKERIREYKIVPETPMLTTKDKLYQQEKLLLDVTRGKGYLAGAFWKFKGNSPLPRQGFKLHVSATAENAGEIATLLLPELKRRGISHKVYDSVQDYLEAKGTQQGKFITIYPHDNKEAREIADYINSALQKNGIKNLPQVAGEKAVGNGVFARYGIINGDFAAVNGVTKESLLIRVDSAGRVLDRNGKIVLQEDRQPILVDTIRNRDVAEQREIGDLLQSVGAVVQDPRGSYKPDWVTDSPF